MKATPPAAAALERRRLCGVRTPRAHVGRHERRGGTGVCRARALAQVLGEGQGAIGITPARGGTETGDQRYGE
ncbi:MAG: hypothetical protein H0X28_13465 [Solirubrobacterales bacterium]|nr:hypothetical protein [Solirubrobacterales bacterium]